MTEPIELTDEEMEIEDCTGGFNSGEYYRLSIYRTNVRKLKQIKKQILKWQEFYNKSPTTLREAFAEIQVLKKQTGILGDKK
jgi:hypothetical protein